MTAPAKDPTLLETKNHEAKHKEILSPAGALGVLPTCRAYLRMTPSWPPPLSLPPRKPELPQCTGRLTAGPLSMCYFLIDVLLGLALACLAR